MSDQNNNKNFKKKKYYKKKKSQNSSPNGQKKSGNKNRRPKAMSPGKVLQKYDNLLEQHLIARKKYFEMYARAKGSTLDKITKNYNKTLKDVFNYRNSLNEWQKEALDKKLDLYPQDNQFSQEHGLPLVGEVELEDKEFDIHLLESQTGHNFSEDTEQSTGTMDDYNKYKEGLL
ncbi:MAG: hypothetical protein N4A33_00765 [Bacteriovoracaceae bacterium]|jgi:hypothetical protein|nr:hypothetical protein [Bacteriovoracaceae bacterium]